MTRKLLEGRKQPLQDEGMNTLRQEQTRVNTKQKHFKTVDLTHKKEATCGL